MFSGKMRYKIAAKERFGLRRAVAAQPKHGLCCVATARRRPNLSLAAILYRILTLRQIPPFFSPTILPSRRIVSSHKSCGRSNSASAHTLSLRRCLTFLHFTRPDKVPMKRQRFLLIFGFICAFAGLFLWPFVKENYYARSIAKMPSAEVEAQTLALNRLTIPPDGTPPA